VVKRSGVGQDDLRRVNLSALLRRVHVSGPTSRAALTQELGLNRSTIGDLTAQLEAFGLVRNERPSRADGTGRPSYVVVPRDDIAVLAVAMDVDRIAVAVVGLGGVVLDRLERRHDRGGHGVLAVVESVAQLCETLLARFRGTCVGVGASVPGVVRAEDGLVRFAPNLGWTDEPFTEMLQARLQQPVVTGNDANLGVLAEHLRGAAVDFDDVAYIRGGVGIGGGFLVGGVPLRGAGGYAGEVGHLLVDTNGRECRCGARGCWETKVGENQLLEAVGRLPGGGPAAVAEVIADAVAGDQRSLAAVGEHAYWIGLGLGAIVNLFDPAVIVLDGLLASIWLSRPNAVTAALGSVSLEAPRRMMHVVSTELGGDSALVGAAETAFAPLLNNPWAVSPSPHTEDVAG
jgi:predicted NBD/HSP70 family sugar kinase